MGLLLVATVLTTGVGFLVGVVVRAQDASTLLVLGISFALGAGAVPLLIRLGRNRTGAIPSWAFGAIIGACPILAALLPGPAIVALLAMGAGFSLTFAPVYIANQRAHMTEIEARWASWQD